MLPTPSQSLSPSLLNFAIRAVHARHGLITGLFEQPPNPSASGIRVAHAVVTPPVYFRANSYSTIQTIDAGTGAGFDRETACWAAIGEAVERYSASIYWNDQITSASAEELGEQALDMQQMIRIGHPAVVPFDRRKIRGWVRGCLLHNFEPTFIPAALCILGYQAKHSDEVIAQNDSTGLACGRSFEDAVLRGLCEVVERDAFASNWLLGRAPPRIVFGAASRTCLSPAVSNALDADRLTLKLYSLANTFGIHVVLGLAEHKDLGIGVVSAAASPSAKRAVEKAVAEAMHGWTAASVLVNHREIDSPDSISAPLDHVRYYLDPLRFKYVLQLGASDEKIAFEDLLHAEREPLDLHSVVAKAHGEGFVAAAVDLTPQDVKDLGLSVARVVIPGLQPLVFGSTCVQVPDARRLDYWRRRWNIPGEFLNKNPHPFP